MKLYLLEQDENGSRAAVTSCVVVAKNKEDARNIHPFGDWDRVEVWPYGPDEVKVTYLGSARKDTIILESLEKRLGECIKLASTLDPQLCSWRIQNALAVARMAIEDMVLDNESR